MDSYETSPVQGQNGFNLPPITNPPRAQIFGGQSGNASPTILDFNFDTDMNGQDHDGPDNETNDAKRRRIARACDMCRKKKIKCDGKMPACGHCINYKTECIFTLVEKKRNPPKGAKYIEGLENRLGRMESLLKLSGLLGDEDGDRTDLGMLERRLADKASSSRNKPQSETGVVEESSPSVNGSLGQLASPNSTPRTDKLPTPQPTDTSPEATKDKERPEVEELSDMMCSLVTNNCGETRYIGKVVPCTFAFTTNATSRIIFRFFHILTQRYLLGQREDRRHIFPRHDGLSSCPRRQVGVLEARSLQ